jgi:hypothetical protein
MVAASKAWSLSRFLYTSLLPGLSVDEYFDWKDFTSVSFNFDNKFETVLSRDEHESIEAHWKCIFRLGQECYKDIDYNNNGNPIIPPLLSILQDMQPVLNETNNVPTATPLEEPIFDIDSNRTNNFERNTSPEGVPPSRESDREEELNFPVGVSGQERVTQPKETITDSAPIDIGENSHQRRPRRNVGTYRDGPANIRKFPIKRESYDYSFVSDFND